MTELKGDERCPEGVNYLDWLMSLDPLDLSAQNIDDIILIQRRARASAEAGIKPKKGSAAALPKLESIGLAPKKVEIKRRKIT